MMGVRKLLLGLLMLALLVLPAGPRGAGGMAAPLQPHAAVPLPPHSAADPCPGHDATMPHAPGLAVPRPRQDDRHPHDPDDRTAGCVAACCLAFDTARPAGLATPAPRPSLAPRPEARPLAAGIPVAPVLRPPRFLA